jgi:hypothetical protein
MSKKKEFLEVEFMNSNIPEYMERNNITCRDYENYDIPIEELAWPSNKKERKRYIKRVLSEMKNDEFFIPSKKLADNIEDGKNRDYLNLMFNIKDFGDPRTREEEMIASHRFMMEYNCTLDKEDKYYV